LLTVSEISEIFLFNSHIVFRDGFDTGIRYILRLHFLRTAGGRHRHREERDSHFANIFTSVVFGPLDPDPLVRGTGYGSGAGSGFFYCSVPIGLIFYRERAS